VRRLLENTSNDSFLRASFAEHVSIEELLMKPASHAATQPPPAREPQGDVFRNEPHTDFSRAENRQAMQQALAPVPEPLEGEYPLVKKGKRIDTKQTIASRNPSRRRQIVGRVASASAEHVAAALQAARRAFPAWARTEPQFRTEYIDLVGAKMRERRVRS